MFSALGVLFRGWICSKGGNLSVRIVTSRILPKHYPGVSGLPSEIRTGCSSECEIGKERVRAVSYLVQAGMCTCVEYGKLGCTCIILSLSLAAILVQL